MATYYATLNRWGELDVRRTADGATVAGELVDADTPERMQAAAATWLTTGHARWRTVGGWTADGDGWRIDVERE